MEEVGVATVALLVVVDDYASDCFSWNPVPSPPHNPTRLLARAAAAGCCQKK